MERLTKVDGIGQNESIKCFACDLERAGAELEHCGYCEHWQAVLDRLAAYEDKIPFDRLDEAAALVKGDTYAPPAGMRRTGDKPIVWITVVGVKMLRFGPGGPTMALIEREAAKKALQEKVFSNYTNEFYGAMQALDELPIIDAAPVVHGRWVSPYTLDCHCSVCGEQPECEQGESVPLYDYCPYCGARMDGGEGHGL